MTGLDYVRAALAVYLIVMVGLYYWLRVGLVKLREELRRKLDARPQERPSVPER
jgi:hypothetical protein